MCIVHNFQHGLQCILRVHDLLLSLISHCSVWGVISECPWSHSTQAWRLIASRVCVSHVRQSRTRRRSRPWNKYVQDDLLCIRPMFRYDRISHGRPSLGRPCWNLQGGPKNVPLCFCQYLRQLLTDFQNSSTNTFCGQFAIMWLLYIPLHRKCVSTLPCEIWMKFACITTITNKHFGNIEKKHFRSILQWMISITLDCVGLSYTV